MDLSKLVEYERLYPLEILDPVTEKPTGMVWQIRSAESAPVKKVIREQVDEVYERRQRGKLLTGDSEIRRELERVAAYIAAWDWGPHDWKGKKPELTIKNAVEVLETAGWIYVQVKGAAEKLENFSSSSSPTSSKPSD